MTPVPTSFQGIAEQLWKGSSSADLGEIDRTARAISLAVQATRPSLFDLCKCGHHHVGGEMCLGCDCDQQRKYTMEEYKAEIAVRMADL